MKYVRKHKKTKKEAIECACSIHRKFDEGKKDALRCLGHGKLCPCTKAIKEDNLVNRVHKILTSKESYNQPTS